MFCTYKTLESSTHIDKKSKPFENQPSNFSKVLWWRGLPSTRRPFQLKGKFIINIRFSHHPNILKQHGSSSQPGFFQSICEKCIPI